MNKTIWWAGWIITIPIRLLVGIIGAVIEAIWPNDWNKSYPNAAVKPPS